VARLVVAALSARLLAESARDAGYEVVALDVFGDRDTRAASVRWLPIGAGLQIDAAMLCRALRDLRADGWIAGAGIEPHLAAACAAAPQLPLIGSPPEVVATVRDGATFFAALHELGIAFPETRVADDAPAGEGWLRKDVHGSGGWHVHAAGARTAAAHYLQRVQAGEPISALFVADGREAQLIGVQRQLVRPRAGRPYVFHGIVGPIALGEALCAGIARIVERLVERFALIGLGSVDLLLDGETPVVLEVNPRPTASIALYDRDGAMVRAHIDGCRHRRLAGPASMPGEPRGSEIVFAERRSIAGDRFAPWCHDLPAAGRCIERDDPVCTVSATAATENEVLALLAARRDEVLASLEPVR
jgi:predicted ATP-grasp superfamily ATP-dependent carboligase